MTKKNETLLSHLKSFYKTREEHLQQEFQKIKVVVKDKLTTAVSKGETEYQMGIRFAGENKNKLKQWLIDEGLTVESVGSKSIIISGWITKNDNKK